MPLASAPPKTMQGGAIPFIKVENGLYQVTNEAREFWQSVPMDVSILVVVGGYRTGKSLLMNKCLLHRQGGSKFAVGATVNSCTKGIWVYPKVIEVESGNRRRKVVIMDSEGLGSLDAVSASHDSRVFALALLLSSCVVYNSMGPIDEGALETLSLVLRISDQLRINAQDESTATADALAPFMPQFRWILRDFSLRLVDGQGGAMSTDEYFESALADTKNPDRNAIRRKIRECFPDRRCVTMSRPCDDEDDLQRLDTLPVESMKPQFQAQLDGLRRLLLVESPVKTMMGHSISGSMLVSMATSLCEAINRGDAPVIKDSWALMCEVRDQDTTNDIICEFTSATNNWRNCIMPIEEIQRRLASMRASYTSMLIERCTSSDGPSDKMRRRLDDAISAREAEILTAIQHNIDKAADDAVATIGRDVSQASANRDLTWQFVVDRIGEATAEATSQLGDTIANHLKVNILTELIRRPDGWGDKAVRATDQAARQVKVDLDAANRSLDAVRQELASAVEKATLAEDRVAEAERRADNQKTQHENDLKGIREEYRVTAEDRERCLRESLDAKSAEIDQWVAKQTTAVDEIGKLNQKMVSIEGERDALRLRVSEIEDALAQLQDSRTHVEEDIKQSEALAQKTLDLEKQVADLMTEVKQKDQCARDTIAQSEATIAEIREIASRQLKERTDDMQSKMRELEMRLEQQAKEGEDLRGAAEKKETTLEMQIGQLRQQLAAATRQVENDRDRSREYKEQAEAAVEDRKRTAEASELRLQSLESKHASIMLKQDEKISSIQREANAEVQQAQAQSRRFEEECRHLKRALDDRMVEVQDLKRKKRELDDASVTKARLGARVEFMEQALEEKRSEIADHKAKIGQLERERDAATCRDLVSGFSLG